jgi:hypothetical protein
MRRTTLLMTVSVISTQVCADITGFVQLRQSERTRSLPEDLAIEARGTMVQQLEGELLYERRIGDELDATGRLVTGYDSAVQEDLTKVREAFVGWTPSGSWNLRVGRQVLTWGVSDYLYVNDIFPKNYDAFFSGATFDRIKEPVDALRAVGRWNSADVEVVVSRSRTDEGPLAQRFAATFPTRVASELHDDNAADVAVRLSRHVSGWDLSGYLASFRSREGRFFVSPAGLSYDTPRTSHVGVSIAGNFAAGVMWAEAAWRQADDKQSGVVSRYSVGHSLKSIIGYAREIGADSTISSQLHLERPLDRRRYGQTLAPGVRPVDSVISTWYLRAERRWMNQTLRAGLQCFLGNEGDSHFNPFAHWSPADGWSVEAGANALSGRPDTRLGAIRDDSNLYVLTRYSF